MSYNLCIEFESASTKKEVADWFDYIKASLPDGATGEVKLNETTVNAEDLTKDNIGDTVRFALPDGGAVMGPLENVFPAGRHEVARVLVVNGTAHLLTYALVHLSN